MNHGSEEARPEPYDYSMANLDLGPNHLREEGTCLSTEENILLLSIVRMLSFAFAKAY